MEKYGNIVDLIRKIYREPQAFIPLHAPVFRGNEKKYLEECIDTTFVSSVGKFVDLFEEKIAEYTGAKKAVVCVNGTNALHLALSMVGAERNTEVITQPLTFIATANAISYCGAHPVFLDVDTDTMGLSPLALRNWLEKNVKLKIPNPEPETGNREPRTENREPINIKTSRRISACVPMHTFGHPCKIDEIAEICKNYNIPLVEDAAESLGSYYKGRHTGTFGKIGVLSFNGNKILTTGGGGMLLFMDEEMAKRAKHLTTQAKVPHPWDFFHDEIGYNYRMPNVNAALGLAQLEQLDYFLDSKRKVAEVYKNYFKNSDVEFISEPQHAKSNYWLNSILFKDKIARDEFLKFTNGKGVMTRPAWALMNKLPMFQKSLTGDLSQAENLEARLVNIPSSVTKD